MCRSPSFEFLVSYEIDVVRLPLVEVYSAASFVAVAVFVEVSVEVVVDVVPVVVVVTMFRLGRKASSDLSDLRSLDCNLVTVLISIEVLTLAVELPSILVEFELSAVLLVATVGILIIRIRLGISITTKAKTEAMAMIGFTFLRIFSREGIF